MWWFHNWEWSAELHFKEDEDKGEAGSQVSYKQKPNVSELMCRWKYVLTRVHAVLQGLAATQHQESMLHCESAGLAETQQATVCFPAKSLKG